MANEATVKTGDGDRYVEDPAFVPEASDMRKQFNTSGLGASDKIEETSAVFDLDKAKTAEQIVKALDPKDSSVSSDRVLLPEGDVTPEEARKSITEAAKARLKEPVQLGSSPSPAEKQAAEKGDDNPTKKDASATEGPRAEAGGNVAPPQAPAGQAGSGSTTPAKKSASSDSSTAKKSSASSGAQEQTAKKTTSSSSS